MDVLKHYDTLLVMTVEPGFGGQSFMADMMDKVRRARSLVDTGHLSVVVEVDGGISADTIEMPRRPAPTASSPGRRSTRPRIPRWRWPGCGRPRHGRAPLPDLAGPAGGPGGWWTMDRATRLPFDQQRPQVEGKRMFTGIVEERGRIVDCAPRSGRRADRPG